MASRRRMASKRRMASGRAGRPSARGEPQPEATPGDAREPEHAAALSRIPRARQPGAAATPVARSCPANPDTGRARGVTERAVPHGVEYARVAADHGPAPPCGARYVVAGRRLAVSLPAFRRRCRLAARVAGSIPS